MQKAYQTQLLQQANINIVNIRNSEMTYYSNCFSSYSIQCGLVAGFVLQSLTNLNLNYAKITPAHILRILRINYAKKYAKITQNYAKNYAIPLY